MTQQTQQIAPLTDQQAEQFFSKLQQFRNSLDPHEQAALDAMVARLNATPETAEVQGYDAGDNPSRANIALGGDTVQPAWRYAGPPVVYYTPTPGLYYGVPVAQPVPVYWRRWWPY